MEKLREIYLCAGNAILGKESDEWKEIFIPFVDEIDKVNQSMWITFGLASTFDRQILGSYGPYWWSSFGCPATNSIFEHEGKLWKCDQHGLLTFSKTQQEG